MHLTNIFLLTFCVCIGSVSPLLWGSWQIPPLQSSILTDLVHTITNGMCSYFVAHPDRAKITIGKINETLYKTNETTQTFTLTIAYLNAPDTLGKLTNSTSTCSTFFNETSDKLVNDWKNKNFSLKDAQQKALDTLTNIYNTFLNSIK